MENLVLPKRRSNAFIGQVSAASSLVKKRWLVHVLARLAIAASCTSSSAALDSQVDRSKSLSSADSSLEHLMPNSSK
jgi:hypothetical protein